MDTTDEWQRNQPLYTIFRFYVRQPARISRPDGPPTISLLRELVFHHFDHFRHWYRPLLRTTHSHHVRCYWHARLHDCSVRNVIHQLAGFAPCHVCIPFPLRCFLCNWLAGYELAMGCRADSAQHSRARQCSGELLILGAFGKKKIFLTLNAVHRRQLARKLLCRHHLSSDVYQHPIQDVRSLQRVPGRYAAFDLLLLPGDWFAQSRRDRPSVRRRNYARKPLVLCCPCCQTGAKMVRRRGREGNDLLECRQFDRAVLGARVSHEAPRTAEWSSFQRRKCVDIVCYTCSGWVRRI